MKSIQIEKKKRNKWFIVIGVIILIYLVSFSISKIVKYSAPDQIAIIPIKGAIVSSGDSSLPLQSASASSSKIVEFIEAANKNPSIKGIILEINSPGGTVIASKEVAEAVKRSPKPIVSWIREIGTSGAYWVASASDSIVADELSIVGSIGVTSSYLQFSGLLEKYGVGYERLVTGEFKDIGSPFKDLSVKERQELEKRLFKIHDAFVSEVAKNRNIEKEKVKELATGIFYLGSDAKEYGLIDHLGGKELAINITKELAKIKDAKIVTYQEQKSLLQVLQKLETTMFYNIGVGIGDSIISKAESDSLIIKS